MGFSALPEAGDARMRMAMRTMLFRMSVLVGLAMVLWSCATERSQLEVYSPATQGPSAAPEHPEAAAATSTPASEPDGVVIGTLRTRRGQVTVLSTVSGPRYTLRGADGQVLTADAGLDELRESHPEVFQLLNASTAEPEAVLDASVAPTVWAEQPF